MSTSKSRGFMNMKTIASDIIDSNKDENGDNDMSACEIAAQDHSALLTAIINNPETCGDNEFNWYLFTDGSVLFFAWNEMKELTVTQIQDNVNHIRNELAQLRKTL